MEEEKDVFEGFKKEIGNQIVCCENDIKGFTRRSKEQEEYLIATLKNLELKKRQIKDLKKFSKDVNKTIEEQIEEIKKLPFVKGVRLTTKGISIDVGRIEINCRGSDVYIGDFTISINPKGVEVKNRNPVIIKEGDYKIIMEHPHIENGHTCYGEERKIKINEYFAQFQLKQLVYMVYLFLKTYSERDKYNSITYWTQNAERKVRKQSMKIDIKDDVILKEEVVKESGEIKLGEII